MKSTVTSFTQTFDKNKMLNTYMSTHSFRSFNMNDFNYLDVDNLKEELIKIKSRDKRKNPYYNNKNIKSESNIQKINLRKSFNYENTLNLKSDFKDKNIKNMREFFNLNMNNNNNTMINSLKINSKKFKNKFDIILNTNYINDKYYKINLIQKKYNDLKIQTNNLFHQLDIYKNKCKINKENINKEKKNKINFETFYKEENENKEFNDLKIKEYEQLKNENETLKKEINNLKEKIKIESQMNENNNIKEEEKEDQTLKIEKSEQITENENIKEEKSNQNEKENLNENKELEDTEIKIEEKKIKEEEEKEEKETPLKNE